MAIIKNPIKRTEKRMNFYEFNKNNNNIQFSTNASCELIIDKHPKRRKTELY